MGDCMGCFETIVKVTILFFLWSGKIVFGQGILMLIFCVNHAIDEKIFVYINKLCAQIFAHSMSNQT